MSDDLKRAYEHLASCAWTFVDMHAAGIDHVPVTINRELFRHLVDALKEVERQWSADERTD